jgi:ParB family transcriptional regulator, chromosome partitioning protein
MALGKGLSALIQDPQDRAHGDVLQVATAAIKDNKLQPRQTYDVVKIEELAASIKEKGLLQPILVRRAGEGYEVVAGERRLKAARKLGLEKVPVIIREVDDREALVLALVENIQREELNAIEEAESFRKLVDDFKYSQEDVARMVSKDRATVANLIRLLKLPDVMKKAIVNGQLTAGHARALLSVEDADARSALFATIVGKGLSVRAAEAGAKSVSKKTGKKTAAKDPEIAALEGELRQILGTKVQVINKRGNKGKLVVEYYSLNDLDRILAVLRK